MKNTPKMIIIHCSDVTEKQWDQFQAINTYHKNDRGFPISSLGYYVGYQRLITGGKNYQCRLDTDVGAHCNQQVDGLSVNFQSLGICVGFDGDIEYMSMVHYDLLKKQVKDWQKQYSIPNEKVFFHRHFALEKSCPGNLLDSEWLRNLLAIDPSPDKDSCLVEKEIIVQKDKQIFNLQTLVQSIIKLFNKKIS